jgi:hypothetical protein
MTGSTVFGETIVADADEKRRRLGRVYKLLVDLARQNDAAEEGNRSEPIPAPR